MLKRVFIQRDAEPPVLIPGEGNPANAYTFLRSVQFNSGKPFSVVNLHLDQRLFLRDSKRFTRSAALPKIVEMEDVVITHAYQRFTIGVADPETADLLEIGLGEPTADCQLTVIDDKDVAIYVADIHYLKNCFVLRSDLLKHSPPRQVAGQGARRLRGRPTRSRASGRARPRSVVAAPSFALRRTRFGKAAREENFFKNRSDRRRSGRCAEAVCY